jgi:hypothetical protein
MAESEHLKDFKAVWGDSCQSMWAELLALTISEAHITANYPTIPKDELLTDLFYAPKLRSRLNDLKKDTFLERVNTYRQAVITNRLVVLSASFETYLSNFFDAFITTKPKYWNSAAATRTTAGDKLFGEITKQRGLDNKILKFAELAPAKIKSIDSRLSYLVDVYMLRNVLAHRAGLLDATAATSLTHIKCSPGERISITTDQLLLLAAPVIKIAESLDQKI